MSAAEGICTAGGSAGDRRGPDPSKCRSLRLEGSSSHLVTFSVLPLEIGLHNINFSLETSLGREILVKTLRVVVRNTRFPPVLFKNTFLVVKGVRSLPLMSPEQAGRLEHGAAPDPNTDKAP